MEHNDFAKKLYSDIIMRSLCTKVLFLKLFMLIVLSRNSIDNVQRLVHVKPLYLWSKQLISWVAVCEILENNMLVLVGEEVHWTWPVIRVPFGVSLKCLWNILSCVISVSDPLTCDTRSSYVWSVILWFHLYGSEDELNA